MKEILTKLIALQTELKAPKNQFNKFGGYKYRSCEDILEAVKPLLKKQGCSLTISDTMENIGDRYYIKATVTVYDTATGESISNSAYAREEESKKGMDGSQITGTASSYARKYALNGLFLIDDTKDADTNEFKNQQTDTKDADTNEFKNQQTDTKDADTNEFKNQQTGEAPQNDVISPICPKCGKPVKGFTRPDGSQATGQDVLDHFGMCIPCNKAAKK